VSQRKRIVYFQILNEYSFVVEEQEEYDEEEHDDDERKEVAVEKCIWIHERVRIVGSILHCWIEEIGDVSDIVRFGSIITVGEVLEVPPPCGYEDHSGSGVLYRVILASTNDICKRVLD
jgi:hypothetical protein